MRKFICKLFALVLFCTLFTNATFSNEIIKAGKTFYLIDANDDICRNALYDSGHGTYFFGDNGKMKVGWWQNPKNNEIYFFDNKVGGPTYGVMQFGLKTIDGYLRYFNLDGTLARSNSDVRIDVLGLYVADTRGNLYDKSGNVMRDVSEKTSDFYANAEYYKNNFNNKMLADTGKVTLWDGERYVNENKSVEEYNASIDKMKRANLNDKINSNSGMVVSTKK